MSQAINAYYTITASSEFHERERLRAKARHDEAQALHHARNEGIIKGRNEEKFNLAQVLLAEGDSFEKVARCTGLSVDEIARLSNTD